MTVEVMHMKRMLAIFAVILLFCSACGTVESPEALFAEKIGDMAVVSYAYETVDGLELCDVAVTLSEQGIAHDVFAGSAEMVDEMTARGNTKSYVLRIASVPTMHYIYAKKSDGWAHVYTTNSVEVTESHDWYIVYSEKGGFVTDDDEREEAAVITADGYAQRLAAAAAACREGGRPAVVCVDSYTAEAVYNGEKVGELTLDIPCPADVDALARLLK